jgi:oligosaccharyltransferase complex subunit beta
VLLYQLPVPPNYGSGCRLGASGNEQLAVSASLWAFQQRGVLMVEGPRHRLLTDAPGSPAPAGYRVNDEVEFALDVWEVVDGKKKPFV